MRQQANRFWVSVQRAGAYIDFRNSDGKRSADLYWFGTMPIFSLKTHGNAEMAGVGSFRW